MKQIVHQNGTVQNLGCTKFTKRCNETAFYDNAFDVRVNTPPCCRKNIIDMFRHITVELERLHVSYVLSFGAVIGWMRNKKMIPYDQDLDIIVDKSFWNSTLYWDFLHRLNTEYGHTYTIRDNGKKIWIMYSSNNSNSIDVWPYTITSKEQNKCPTVMIPHFYWKEQPIENIFPAQFVQFENITTYIPRKPKAYLDLTYGKNRWEKELDCKKVQDGKCLSHDIHESEMFLGYLFILAVCVIIGFIAMLCSNLIRIFE